MQQNFPGESHEHFLGNWTDEPSPYMPENPSVNFSNTTDELPPPYVPYKSFSNYIDTLKQNGLPSHIEKAVLPASMSGSLQNQMLAAFRGLSLIQSDGQPTQILEELVQSDDSQRQEVLRKILINAYPTLFKDPNFDLSRTTEPKLKSKIEELGISGDTVRRAMLFFIQAAKEAGIPLSSYVIDIAKRRSSTKSSSTKSSKPKKRFNSEESAQYLVGYEEALKPQSMQATELDTNNQPTWKEKMEWSKEILKMRLEKLPDFNPEWSPEVQKVWFETLNRLSSIDNLEE